MDIRGYRDGGGTPAPPLMEDSYTTVDLAEFDQLIRSLEVNQEAIPKRWSQKEAGSLLTLALKASGLLLSASVALYGAKHFDLIDFGFETETTASGGQVLRSVSISDPTYEIAVVPEYFNGFVEDDAPGFLENPEARTRGLGLKTLKFESEFPIGAKLIYDPELGKELPQYAVYVLVSTFDSEGNDRGFNTSDIKEEAVRPEACWVKAESGSAIEFEGCTEPDEPGYRGAMSTSSSDGGWLDADGSMHDKVGPLRSVQLHNNYCVSGGIFGGPYEEYVENGYQFGPELPKPDKKIMYENRQELVKTAVRPQAASWLGAPLALTLFPNELRFIKEHPDLFKSGSPLPSNDVIYKDLPASVINTQLLDRPVVVDVVKRDFVDADLENFFPGVSSSQSIEELENSQYNYSVCFPYTDESRAQMNSVFDSMSKYGTVAWLVPRDAKPDGTIQPGFENDWREARLAEVGGGA